MLPSDESILRQFFLMQESRPYNSTNEKSRTLNPFGWFEFSKKTSEPNSNFAGTYDSGWVDVCQWYCQQLKFRINVPPMKEMHFYVADKTPT